MRAGGRERKEALGKGKRSYAAACGRCQHNINVNSNINNNIIFIINISINIIINSNSSSSISSSYARRC